jgi:hypothetical protein
VERSALTVAEELAEFEAKRIGQVELLRRMAEKNQRLPGDFALEKLSDTVKGRPIGLFILQTVLKGLSIETSDDAWFMRRFGVDGDINVSTTA